ncbi:MAG: pyrroloquinoline quinone precursor peptide PqqA [Solirubrobacteraceae bacterium]
MHRVTTTNQWSEWFDRISDTGLYSGGSMTWVKPKFEFVELCSEVTSYLHHR